MKINLTIKYVFLSVCAFCLLCIGSSQSAAPTYQAPAIHYLESSLIEDLESTFDRHSYRLDDLDDGVPLLILQTMPADLSDQMTHKRKNIFFQTMLPMILLANQEIHMERADLEAMKQQLDQGLSLEIDQQQRLSKLAKRYKVSAKNGTSQLVAKLLLRVDIIPPELALAQAANESAWGTSRFSKLANNLFGEWTFTPGTGIVPEERPEGATYEVRRFSSIYDSVRSYLLNLNTHRAYRELRQLRAESRAAGQPLNGISLAEGLLHYSTRGEEYVKDLQMLIKKNQLERFSSANLRISS